MSAPDLTRPRRIIPLTREAAVLPMAATDAMPADGMLVNRLGRHIRDLRISVTDRCNFRCSYCMPKEVFDTNYTYLDRSDLLSFEEITTIARQFAALGVEKIRLTGGEPLLRRHIEVLIQELREIPNIEITLTTNGSLLRQKAKAIKDAGLDRVTVSLDALDDAIFRQMNDMDFPVADVLAGIEAADAAGLGPIKINMVVKKGTNDHEILPMVRHFKGTGHVLRFIEYMDVGSCNGWQLNEVLPSADVIARINEEFPLEPIDANYPGEVAQRWRFKDGSGEIGVISSVTQAFCSSCTRIRLSTDGKLYTCLFAQHGHDLRGLLRRSTGAGDAATNEAIRRAIIGVWQQRGDRYSEIRTAETAGAKKIEMSYIGG